MKPLIEFLPIKTGGCSSCGDATAKAIENFMENKIQTFVVQVVVENVEDALSITREMLSKGKVLSANPYNPQQAQRSVTGQSQNIFTKVVPPRSA